MPPPHAANARPGQADQTPADVEANHKLLRVALADGDVGVPGVGERLDSIGPEGDARTGKRVEVWLGAEVRLGR